MIGLCPGSVDVLVLGCLIIVSVANIGLVDVLAVELSRDFTLQHHSQALSNLFSPNEDTNPFTNTIKVWKKPQQRSFSSDQFSFLPDPPAPTANNHNNLSLPDLSLSRGTSSPNSPVQRLQYLQCYRYLHFFSCGSAQPCSFHHRHSSHQLIGIDQQLLH
eukprot:scaffold972_cov317-Alexandrium_tamarense.AAC.1